MAQKQLDGLRIGIIATDLFEQAELLEPRKALDEAGAKTIVVAPHDGEIQGVQHDKKDKRVEVDRKLSDVTADDFDALLLPGGAMNADALRVEKKAQELVRQIDQQGKPIAVICHGPWLLVSAGLVRGRHMTSYHTIQDDLKNAGANWEDKEVICDGNWVSSRKPDDIAAFNREMLQLFSEGKRTGGQRRVA